MPVPVALRENPEENELARFTGVLGLLTMLLLAWIFSTDRRAIRVAPRAANPERRAPRAGREPARSRHRAAAKPARP